MISANDLLIVSHAIALGLMLETTTAEYERVPGLLFDEGAAPMRLRDHVPLGGRRRYGARAPARRVAAATMTTAPAIARAAPSRSAAVGRWPSMPHSQTSDAAM